MQNTTMSTALFAALCLLFIIFGAASATDFKVGSSGGWRVPNENETAMYSQWARRNRFRVGDTLSFEYKNDSVLVVDKFGYYHCNTSQPIPISVFNNYNTVIVKLDRPGLFYFISGDPNHCRIGQRVVVDVMTPHDQIAQSPPSIALPPRTYEDILSPAPSPSPTSSSSSGSMVSVCLGSSLFAALAGTIVMTLF